MLNEINWPEEYLPGFTDNFASNEIIVPGITAEEVFENLLDTSIWPTYYDNVSDVYFYNHDGPVLKRKYPVPFQHIRLPCGSKGH